MAERVTLQLDTLDALLNEIISEDMDMQGVGPSSDVSNAYGPPSSSGGSSSSGAKYPDYGYIPKFDNTAAAEPAPAKITFSSPNPNLPNPSRTNPKPNNFGAPFLPAKNVNGPPGPPRAKTPSIPIVPNPAPKRINIPQAYLGGSSPSTNAPLPQRGPQQRTPTPSFTNASVKAASFGRPPAMTGPPALERARTYSQDNINTSNLTSPLLEKLKVQLASAEREKLELQSKIQTLNQEKEAAVAQEDYDTAAKKKKEVTLKEGELKSKDEEIERLKVDIQNETAAIIQREEEERRRREEEERKRREEEERRRREEEERRRREEEERRREEEERKRREEEDRKSSESRDKRRTTAKEDLLEKYKQKREELLRLKNQCAEAEDFDGALNYKNQIEELDKKYEVILQSSPSAAPPSPTPSPTPSSVHPLPPTAGKGPQFAKVRWNFTSLSSAAMSGETDISVNEGDMCKILRAPRNGWVKVEINGNVGLVPERYLLPIKK